MMNKRIISRYAYPTKYVLHDGGVLQLVPGLNIIDDTLWTRAKREIFRLRAQIATGKVADGGYHADWVIKHAADATARDINALTPKDAKRVAAKVRDKDLLAGLLAKAERGGLKGIFRAALAGR